VNTVNLEPKKHMDHSRVVYVDIGGQRYAIRSHLDQAYIAELAAAVDAKMQLAARESPQGDSLKIAVLAALNIADEWFRARDEESARRARLSHRTEELERMLDLALASAEPADPASSLARTAGSF
jgi:cell division protein ZapA